MDSRTRKVVVAVVIALAALGGVGIANYFLAGDRGGPDGDATIPMIGFDEPPTRSYEPTEILRLGWGEGPREIWVDREWFGATLEGFAITQGGGILLADHPKWHIGARVRRFSRAGELERTWLTPAGSVFFEPFGTGIMYVSARGGGPNEHVHLVSEDGSVEASFPVPPGVDSTSLFRAGDALYVTHEEADLAQDPEALRLEPEVVRIVQLAPDGPIAAPAQALSPGAGADTDGELFGRLVESDSWVVHQGSTQTVTVRDGRALRVPGTALPFGVDGSLVWMVMPRAKAPDSRVDRPAWPYGTSPEAEVIAADLDGTLVARLVVPWSPLLPDGQRRLLVTRGALWLLRADTEGIALVRYTAVDR